MNKKTQTATEILQEALDENRAAYVNYQDLNFIVSLDTIGRFVDGMNQQCVRDIKRKQAIFSGTLDALAWSAHHHNQIDKTTMDMIANMAECHLAASIVVGDADMKTISNPGELTIVLGPSIFDVVAPIKINDRNDKPIT